MTKAVCYILDSSPFARSTQIAPSYLDAQKEFVRNKVHNDIAEREGVSTASLVSFGAQPTLLTPQTNSRTVLQQSLDQLIYQPQMSLNSKSISSKCLVQALNFAVLALNQRARKDSVPSITLFLASPVEFDATFEKQAGVLKKNGIPVSVMLIGRGMSCKSQMMKLTDSTNGTLIECDNQISDGTVAAAEPGYDEDDDFELQQIKALSMQEYAENLRKGGK